MGFLIATFYLIPVILKRAYSFLMNFYITNTSSPLLKCLSGKKQIVLQSVIFLYKGICFLKKPMVLYAVKFIYLCMEVNGEKWKKVKKIKPLSNP